MHDRQPLEDSRLRSNDLHACDALVWSQIRIHRLYFQQDGYRFRQLSESSDAQFIWLAATTLWASATTRKRGYRSSPALITLPSLI